MEEYLVSVLIPVYNSQKDLDRCLASIIKQTYENLEIIIVDDGSTDDSSIIYNKYALQDSRIKIIKQENEGVSSARNKALNVTNGDFCYFCDSDDYLEYSAIKTAVDLIIKHTSDLLVFNLDHIDEYGNKTGERQIKDFSYNISTDEDKLLFYTKFYNNEFAFELWNKIYKMDIIKKYNIRFEDINKVGGEDLYFNSLYILYAQNVKTVSTILYHYQMGRMNSITCTTSNKSRIKEFLYFASIFEKKVFNSEHKDLYKLHYMLFAQLMHHRLHYYSVFKIPELIIYERLGELENYYLEKTEKILHDKKNVEKYFNTTLPRKYHAGTRIIEESYFIKYRNNPLICFFITILVIVNKVKYKIFTFD